MAIYDFSPPDKGPRSNPELTIIVNAKASTGSPWMHELMVAKADQVSSMSPKTSSLNYSGGAISRARLPDGWTAGKEVKNANIGYEEFVPPGATGRDTRIHFLQHAIPIPKSEAENFRNLLSMPDHQLSKAEIASLGEVMDSKQNPADFRTDRAWTEMVNDKRVLMVEGEFLHDNKKTLSMIADKKGTGTNIQEVSFRAPATDYSTYKPQAEQTMKSVEWK